LDSDGEPDADFTGQTLSLTSSDGNSSGVVALYSGSNNGAVLLESSQ
jgi:hypothetical protein